jgi:hypothetical protein
MDQGKTIEELIGSCEDNQDERLILLAAISILRKMANDRQAELEQLTEKGGTHETQDRDLPADAH